jgi:hypothetical protein
MFFFENKNTSVKILANGKFPSWFSHMIKEYIIKFESNHLIIENKQYYTMFYQH